MRVFGLTGGIASGKSTVSRHFASWGVPVVDADKISREVVRPGTPAYIEVIDKFGPRVVLPDGELDRKALGSIVFSDLEKRRLLNSIIHPRIAERTQALFDELRSQGEHLACYDAPLNVESGLEEAFRPVVVVTVPYDVQVDRIMKRDGLTSAEAIARIMSQAPQARKTAKADIIINNDKDLAELEARSRSALDEVCARINRRVP